MFFKKDGTVRSLGAKDICLLKRMFHVHSSVLKLPSKIALPSSIEGAAYDLGISQERCMALWKFHLELVNEETERKNVVKKNDETNELSKCIIDCNWKSFVVLLLLLLVGPVFVLWLLKCINMGMCLVVAVDHLTPVVTNLIWPLFISVILLSYKKQVLRVLDELPGFVHRSSYGMRVEMSHAPKNKQDEEDEDEKQSVSVSDVSDDNQRKVSESNPYERADYTSQVCALLEKHSGLAVSREMRLFDMDYVFDGVMNTDSGVIAIEVKNTTTNVKAIGQTISRMANAYFRLDRRKQDQIQLRLYVQESVRDRVMTLIASRFLNCRISLFTYIVVGESSVALA